MWQLLGLDDKDEKVYRFTLRTPGASPQEVGRATALDPASVSNSFNRLVDCGLLRRDLHDAVRPNPTGPTAVAERLREQLEAEHDRRRRQVSRFQADMTRWLNDQILTAPTNQPQVDRLPSVEAAVLRTEELLVNARAEIARCRPGPDLTARGRSPVALPGEVRALRRGVDVRVIYPPEQLKEPGVRRAVDGELQAGLAVRVAATPETSMVVVDRSAAVVFDHRHPAEIRTFFIREGILIRVLQDLFEIGWTQAGEASSFLCDEADGVAASDRLLLKVLGEGLKDEVVARRLGVSVRTVRRKIGELQRRLGAESRFQIGMLAAQRGWV